MRATQRRMPVEVRICMLASMRTTLVIDDALFRRAKVAAAKHGSTMSELVERALRDVLREDATPAEAPFVFPVYGNQPLGGRSGALRPPS